MVRPGLCTVLRVAFNFGRVVIYLTRPCDLESLCDTDWAEFESLLPGLPTAKRLGLAPVKSDPRLYDSAAIIMVMQITLNTEPHARARFLPGRHYVKVSTTLAVFKMRSPLAGWPPSRKSSGCSLMSRCVRAAAPFSLSESSDKRNRNRSRLS